MSRLQLTTVSVGLVVSMYVFDTMQQEARKSQVTNYTILHNMCTRCGHLSLPRRWVLINNDDGCDKAHITTVTLFYVARDRYEEVAIDKWASSSLTLVSLWYRDLPVCLNSTSNVPQWQRSPSSFSSPATPSNSGLSPTSKRNSSHASLSLRYPYQRNNLYQDLNIRHASSSLRRMLLSPSTRLPNSEYK
jgi:hypothetical protein